MYPPDLNNRDQPFPDLRYQPFQVRQPSGYAVHGDQLLGDKANVLKNFADIYGAKLFQARDDISLQLTRLGENIEFRA